MPGLFIYMPLASALLGGAVFCLLIWRIRYAANGISLWNLGKTTAEKLLLLMIAVLAIQSFFTFLTFRNLIDYFTPILIGRGFLNLVFWPLFYLYTGFKTSKISKLKKIHILHFLIVILALGGAVKLIQADYGRSSPPNGLKAPPGNIRTGIWPMGMDRKGEIPRLMQPPMRPEGDFIGPGTGNPFRRPFGVGIQPLNKAALLQLDILLWIYQGALPMLSQSGYAEVPGLFFRPLSPGGLPEKLNLVGLYIHLFGWIYIILASIYVFKYYGRLRYRSTNHERANLMWLTVLVSIIGIIHLVLTFLFFFGTFSNRAPVFFLGGSLPVPLFYIATIGGYLILRRNPKVNDNKYGKNALSVYELEHYHQMLLQYMVKNKPYRDESLSLKNLADKMNIHSNALSQVINQKQGCHFNDFINYFRVEEVKMALLKPENEYKNILAVAYEAGFNSKSGFNQVFKKYTRMTPSEFIKKQKKNDSLSDRLGN